MYLTTYSISAQKETAKLSEKYNCTMDIEFNMNLSKTMAYTFSSVNFDMTA